MSSANDNNNTNNNQQEEDLPPMEQEDYDDGHQKVDRQQESEALNPPTRRILIFQILCIIAFSLFLAAGFAPIVTPKSGQNGIEVTLLKECTVSAATGKRTNCQDPGTSTSGNLCDAAKSLINASRAFILLAIISAISAAIIATSSFLGAECVARNLKPLTWVSSFCGLLFGIIALGTQVGFSTRKVCDQWPDTLVNLNGGNTYKVGDAVPYTVVSIVLVFIAQVLAAMKATPCLDAFVEYKECCDDGSNGGSNSKRRQTTV